MRISYYPSFHKSYKNRIARNTKLSFQVKERISLFLQDSQNPLLKDHKLKGKMRNYRAFWVTGDIRIIYEVISEDEIIFYDIGTHNQVY